MPALTAVEAATIATATATATATGPRASTAETRRPLAEASRFGALCVRVAIGRSARRKPLSHLAQPLRHLLLGFDEDLDEASRSRPVRARHQS